jgi:hypothetical protein
VGKGKYEYWLTDDGLLLLAAWARDGLTDEQIADKCGISRKTLFEWKNKYSYIGDTLKKGKDLVDIEVENALYREAVSGNITAMIFWLKNRKPKRWRDKPELTTEKAIEKLDMVLDKIGGNI